MTSAKHATVCLCGLHLSRKNGHYVPTKLMCISTFIVKNTEVTVIFCFPRRLQNKNCMNIGNKMLLNSERLEK